MAGEIGGGPHGDRVPTVGWRPPWLKRSYCMVQTPESMVGRLVLLIGRAKMTEIRPELTLLRSHGDAALRRVSQSYPLPRPLGPVDSAAYCQHSAGDWRNRI